MEAFSLQKVVEMLEEVVGGQENVANKAKLCCLIHSTFGLLVVKLAVRHCGELGPFC